MLKICLVFWKSEPQYAYKRYAYKKNMYTYPPFTYKELTNMDYFRALFGSQSIYKQNFEIYGTQNFNRRMFYVK